MMRLLVTAATLTVILSNSVAQPIAKQDDEWIPLFDGRTLAGWTPERDARWRVAEGAIIGDAGGDGWLRSAREYQDFELQIAFRNSVRGNSGVFFRATRESNASDPSNPARGYELQINNEDTSWATGSIENFIQRLRTVTPAANVWHTYDLEVRGDHLTATLDGMKVLDGHDRTFARGYLGLQHHRDNKVEFRDIKLRVTTR